MTKVEAENLPLQRLFHWERARAEQTFLTQPIGGGRVREYSWAEAMEEARRMAAYLQAQDFPPGSRIAIMSKNCAHWLMADFAIWMAGHISVPLYPTLTTESVRQILEHSESSAIFVGKLDAWEPMIRGIPAGLPGIAFPLAPENDFLRWQEVMADTQPLAGQPLREADDLATIIYTSGTTGLPKGVMHSFENLGWCAATLIRTSKATSDDRVLSYLPLSHAAERTALEMVAIRTGLQVFFTESLDTFVEDLKRARPTLFFSVPRLWVKFKQGVSSKLPDKKLKRLLRIPLLGNLLRKKILTQLGLDAVRLAGSGAAPLPEAVMQWYRNLGLELLEGYGMTEVCGLSHMCRPGAVRVGYVGPVMDDVVCRISEEGEVQVQSPGNTLGYYKDPEKTRELFTNDGYIRTGDKGELDEDGRLRITGRIKELFKTSKGKYVGPAPIENKLAEHEAVEACCVMGANYPQPCAMVMLSLEANEHAKDFDNRYGLSQSLQEHLQRVNASLDDHEKLAFVCVVSEIWDVDNGFLTPTLKVKRNSIEEAYGSRLDDWYGKSEAVIWA